MPELLDDWLAKLERRHFRSIDMGLERCGRVYRNMGTPRPAGKIFSISGTNGKGSVAAYISSVASVAGLRCGLYTSPHILNFNERIRIMGEPACDENIVRAFEVVESALDGVSLTYFEFTTLAAFFLMHEAALDIAVLEVGLGGRLDAVNLVDPDCAVITPIGLDHQEYLGDDREKIGYEKAGIMRAGRPVVCGDRDPPESLITHARSVSAILVRAGVDFEMKSRPEGLEFEAGGRRILLDNPPLPGKHQADNLGVALAALERVYPELLEDQGLLSRGVAGTRIAGRLQRLADEPRVLLDVGHNPMAAAVVAEHLATASAGRCVCVIAMLRDKDAESVAGRLEPCVDEWLCAGLEGPRGQSGAALAERIRAHVATSLVHGLETVYDALGRALRETTSGDTILVFGSFETVAAALRYMSDDSVHIREC